MVFGLFSEGRNSVCKQEYEPEVKQASLPTDMVPTHPPHPLSVSQRETLCAISPVWLFFFLFFFGTYSPMFFSADEPLFSNHFQV